MTQSSVRLHYEPMQWESRVCFRGFRQGQCWIPLLPLALVWDPHGCAAPTHSATPSCSREQR